MSEEKSEFLKQLEIERQKQAERQLIIERQRNSDKKNEIERVKPKVLNLNIEGKKTNKDFEGRVSTGDDD